MASTANTRRAARAEPKASRRAAGLIEALAAKPGAAAGPIRAPRAASANAMTYKVLGKMFAIVSLRAPEYVILKCDPNLAQMLRERYAGVGHRSHLPKRYWIAVSLEADVPLTQIKRLAQHSYELVCAGLTRKQRTALQESARTDGQA